MGKYTPGASGHSTPDAAWDRGGPRLVCHVYVSCSAFCQPSKSIKDLHGCICQFSGEITACKWRMHDIRAAAGRAVALSKAMLYAVTTEILILHLS